MKSVYTLGEISQLLNLPCQGPSETVIKGIGTLQQATEGQLTFLDNAIYKKYLAQTQASAIITTAENVASLKIPAIVSKNPYLTYAKVAKLFDNRPLPDIGVHPSAVIGKNVQIHPTARIGALCIVGDNSIIGENCCLWPRVTLYDETILGNNVIVHSGAVIGSDGFGNARDGAAWFKVPQLGRVVIGDDVEIGANTTIDRGALEDTIIENGVRLDNQIQIAHNVKIGAHTAIAACVGIAGSTTIGKHCLIGGAVGIGGHLTIGDGVIITAMTGVTKSITEPGIYSSTTVAQKNLEWRKMTVRLRHLDELFERVGTLEKTMSHQLVEKGE